MLSIDLFDAISHCFNSVNKSSVSAFCIIKSVFCVHKMIFVMIFTTTFTGKSSIIFSYYSKSFFFITYATKTFQSVLFHYFGHVNIIGHDLLVAILAIPFEIAAVTLGAALVDPGGPGGPVPLTLMFRGPSYTFWRPSVQFRISNLLLQIPCCELSELLIGHWSEFTEHI